MQRITLAFLLILILSIHQSQYVEMFLSLTAAPHTDTTTGVLAFKLLFSNQVKWNDNLKVKVVMLLLR